MNTLWKTIKDELEISSTAEKLQLLGVVVTLGGLIVFGVWMIQ